MSQQDIHGFKELQDVLKKLPKRLQNKAIAGGLRASAQVLRKEAVARIGASKLSASGKKKLRRALKVSASASKMKRRGYVVGSVSMRMRQDQENDPFWWHWIDAGTAERKTKAGANRGKIEAQNFFKDAFDGAATVAVDVGTGRIMALALREIEKLKAKPQK